MVDRLMVLQTVLSQIGFATGGTRMSLTGRQVPHLNMVGHPTPATYLLAAERAAPPVKAKAFHQFRRI